ncbi:cuticle protein LPCP-23-like [Euwallacea fornicatus]|uniref:cuticle protein LPCP-23-like n=1 Tax=Euwallacea fornicatus TaxID=995702 RepID=UPI0033900C27
MALKFVILAFTLACANAGDLFAQPQLHYSPAPAVSSSYFQQSSAPLTVTKTIAAQPLAYHAAPATVAVQTPHIGLTQQSLTRSLGGAQSLSTYSKAIDSAYSSVRKYDTRFTNDAIPPALYSAPAQYIARASSPLIYGAPSPVITKSYAAPAPILSYASPGPVVYGAHAPLVTKTYAAPAPVVSFASAPVISKTYSAPAPVLSYGAPTPLLTKAVSAPVVAKAAVAYSPAGLVAHTNFQGYGIEYHY